MDPSGFFPAPVTAYSWGRSAPISASRRPQREYPDPPAQPSVPPPPAVPELPTDLALPRSPPPPKPVISIGSFIPHGLQLSISATPGAGMLAAIDRTYRPDWKICSYTRLLMWMTERVHILETHHRTLTDTITTQSAKRETLLAAYAAHQAEATYHQQPSLRPSTHPLWTPPTLEETVRQMRKLQVEMLKVDEPLRDARVKLPGCMAELRANREYLGQIEARWKRRREAHKNGEEVESRVRKREVEEDKLFLGKYRARRRESKRK